MVDIVPRRAGLHEGFTPPAAGFVPLIALALCLGLMAQAWAASPPASKPDPGVPSAAAQTPLELRIDDALAEAGLDAQRVSLLVFSARDRRYLYQRAIHRPMIPASNAKLATTYAAMRVLLPDYRWRTRFYRVDEHDDAGAGSRQDEPRQGLLVQGTGDPTLTGADLERVAWALRARGVERIDGGIYFDGRQFDDAVFPAGWGQVFQAHPWTAPVSPFIVDGNVLEFLISTRRDGAGFDVFNTTPGYRIVSALRRSDLERPAIRATQHWQGDTATITLRGTLAPAEKPYQFSTAVERPRVHFYRQLRTALERARISGAKSLRLDRIPEPGAHLHTVISPPLREVLVDVNKNSNNLAAEVLLRTMGLQNRSDGASTADGLAVMMRELAAEFPDVRAHLHLVDGSGLSRENRMTALFLVRLLNRVRNDFALRPEFINSLSVALTDGTLQYRNYPWRMRGRLRAKTGTLTHVSNMSGYLQLEHDVIIFSFLIHDPAQHFLALQDAQDAVVVALYDALLASEAGELAGSATGAIPPGSR